MRRVGDAWRSRLGRGFRRASISRTHPADCVRRLLTQARSDDTGDELAPAAPHAEAIPVMTAKTFGCVGIVDRDGKLVGIITDGDLRRHLGVADVLDLKVEAVMTRKPKTVRPGQLASEALEIINSSKITALMVAEAGKPVGIVHFHDLLRAGVA